MVEHGRQRVGKSAFGVRYDKRGRGARHHLEVFKLHGSMKQALSRAAACANDSLVSTVKCRFALHLIHVNFRHSIIFRVRFLTL